MSEDEPRRLDVELVQRGLMASRAQARAAIEVGKVLVDGAAAGKPGQLVTPSSSIVAEPAHPWVSRGGVKLAFAPHEAERYKERTVAERMNARLKDEFGGNNVWVRGPVKVMSHLMFGVLVLSADQLMRLLQ